MDRECKDWDTEQIGSFSLPSLVRFRKMSVLQWDSHVHNQPSPTAVSFDFVINIVH